MPGTGTALQTAPRKRSRVELEFGETAVCTGAVAAGIRRDCAFVDCRTVPDVRYRRQRNVGVRRTWRAAAVIVVRWRHIRAAPVHDAVCGHGSRDATGPDIAACRRIVAAIGARTACVACAENRRRIGGCRRRRRSRILGLRRRSRSTCLALQCRCDTPRGDRGDDRLRGRPALDRIETTAARRRTETRRVGIPAVSNWRSYPCDIPV